MGYRARRVASLLADYHRTKPDDASWDGAVDVGWGAIAWMVFGDFPLKSPT